MPEKERYSELATTDMNGLTREKRGGVAGKKCWPSLSYDDSSRRMVYAPGGGIEGGSPRRGGTGAEEEPPFSGGTCSWEEEGHQ